MASQLILCSYYNGRLPYFEDGYYQYCDISLWVNGVLIKKYEKKLINYDYGNGKVDISSVDPVIEGCSPMRVEALDEPTSVILVVQFDDETYAGDLWEMQVDNFVKEEIHE